MVISVSMERCSKLGESVHQVADGTLAHTGVAVEEVFAVTEGEEGGKEAGGGASVADEEFGSLGGDFSAQAANGHGGVGFIHLNVETEGAEGVGEVARVVGEEGVGDFRRAVGEGGDEQGAVGQRFGAGDADGGREGMIDGENAEGGRVGGGHER